MLELEILSLVMRGLANSSSRAIAPPTRSAANSAAAMLSWSWPRGDGGDVRLRQHLHGRVGRARDGEVGELLQAEILEVALAQ